MHVYATAPLTGRGKSSCPVCRRDFFRKCDTEPLEFVAQRLAFWDMAYVSAGVARSQKEEHSRKYLWQYVEYCRSVKKRSLENIMMLSLHEDAQWVLLHFVKFLKAQALTTTQEMLRLKLERIARKNLEECEFQNGSYVFEIDRDDNEKDEFKDIPLGTFYNSDSEPESEQGDDDESDQEQIETS